MVDRTDLPWPVSVLIGDGDAFRLPVADSAKQRSSSNIRYFFWPNAWVPEWAGAPVRDWPARRGALQSFCGIQLLSYTRWPTAPHLHHGGRGVVLPFWLPAMMATACPFGPATISALRRRRAGRFRRGFCAGCAYDLRGSEQSGRCPECGTAVPYAPAKQGPA